MSAIERGRPGIHATAVVYGECGVLIQGPTGSGKSALSLALLARARTVGAFGALIGDDRIWVRPVGGRLLAYGSSRLAGLVERRGVGLVEAPYEDAALVALIVELSERGQTWPRLPDEPHFAIVEGISLPRLPLNSSWSAADQAAAVEERLGIILAADAERKRISLEHCAAVHKNSRLPVRGRPDDRREPEPAD